MSKWNDARKKFRAEHKGIHDAIGYALLGAVVVMCFVGFATFARAASVTLSSPLCVAFEWNEATKTLTCVPVLSPTPVPPDPPPVVSECTSSDLRVNDGWGKTAIETSTYGAFKNNVLSVKVAPPVGWAGSGYSSWVEYQAGPFNRVAIMSPIPCSFDKTTALKYSGGQPVFVGNQIRPSFKYRAGAATADAAGLTPGQVYYINIKNANSNGAPNCTLSSCSMRGGVPQ